MTRTDANSTTTFDANAQDTRACEQLCYAYARCLDFFDHDSLPELFAADGELALGDASHRGRSAILAYVTGLPRMPTRHVISNVFIDLTGSGNARGIAYVQRFTVDGPQTVQAIGHFEDQYQRHNSEWFFTRRRLHWLSET